MSKLYEIQTDLKLADAIFEIANPSKTKRQLFFIFQKGLILLDVLFYLMTIHISKFASKIQSALGKFTSQFGQKLEINLVKIQCLKLVTECQITAHIKMSKNNV